MHGEKLPACSGAEQSRHHSRHIGLQLARKHDIDKLKRLFEAWGDNLGYLTTLNQNEARLELICAPAQLSEVDLFLSCAADILIFRLSDCDKA